jgi:hypothetical protein
MTGTSLAQQVKSAWPTPAARDWKGSNGPEHLQNGSGRLHMDQLPNFVEHLWPTPTSLSYGESHQPGNSKSMNETMRLASFLPAPEASTSGEPSSPERRSLNPLFVEWLMGWPPKWVRVLTNSGCSATELSRFKQHMRSALLSLGSPREALPEQLSLLA